MRFDFSAPFLQIIPPDRSFGQAWEGLCCALLEAERPTNRIRRVASPDYGIDILDETVGEAFQCKASELGAAGTVAAAPSVESLRRAVAHRQSTDWRKLTFATNGRYTAPAREEVIKAAADVGLSTSAELDFLGPEDWDKYCERHYASIKDRFYYRVSVAELEVIEALRRARYYPQYVSEYATKISNAGYRIVVTNNRTPLEVDIPFSPELTVENCLDTARELLGLSLEWTSFDDLNASAGPALSLTIDRYAQPFGKKLSEIGLKSGDKIELWIKIVCREGNEDAIPSTSDTYLALRYAWPANERAKRAGLDLALPIVRDRGQTTVDRKEALLQAMIWQNASRLATVARQSGA